MIKNIDKKIRGYALKNAIHYNGKANSGAVLSALFNEGLEKKDVKGVILEIQRVIGEISKLSLDKQKEEYEKIRDVLSERESREGLPELPNCEKGVVMRFRPAPSGPLHLGHVISNVYNSIYAEKYKGKFYVIIDDTDPETAIKEAYTEIKKGCDWVFGNVTEYMNASDRLEIYYKYAKKLLLNGRAYVCTCSSEKFKEIAKEKKECPCRKNSIDENIEHWNKMLVKKNGFKEGEAVLRFKTPEEEGGMENPNPAMRDFPLARINESPHPIQKKKYRVWPLMNLSVTVDDIELKMTHVIRGKDHKDNAKRQEMIYKVLGIGKKFPWTFFIGRIKFTDIELSKRKIVEAIKQGKYSGWDDSKLATLSSLKKRGYNPDAFKNFAEERGLTEVDKVISQKDFFQAIEKFNKI
ncbi:MAG: glutamate--tRNA ligase family protein [Nanoarchaeota archaeon]|nr:glutamate--tRNA ligase family protein [Nanoarchaeota archaeon]